jgi:hypothetical protein
MHELYGARAEGAFEESFGDWAGESNEQREAMRCGTWGGNGVFKCFVMAEPKSRTGVVMFTDSDSGWRLLSR